MPQLDTIIFFHEYSWLFFSFFFFYFIFLKYFFPYLVLWMKLENSNLTYHLELIIYLDNLIKKLQYINYTRKFYKLFMTTSTLEGLNSIYLRKIASHINSTQVERTIFNLLKQLK